jgi:putative hydrolase of the HAD superfamily
VPTTTAILFDLDDTLVDDNEATAAALMATCALAAARHGLDPAALAIALWREARRRWQVSPATAFCREMDIGPTEGLRSDFRGEGPHLAALRNWAPGYRQQTWQAALATVGVSDEALAANLAERFVLERDARHRAYPDVAPALAALRHTHRLGIVTNGAADVQQAKIDGAGLAPFFDVVVISAAVSLGKPDRRIFDRALATLAASPETTIMVGDSLTADLPGARNTGLRGVWLDRAGLGPEGNPGPEPRITDLSQLLALV